MALQAGDTFFAPWPEPDNVLHLFCVISNPALNRERVVVVPMMTWNTYKESTCLMEVGEHEFIKHRSYIDYACAELVVADDIEQRLRTKAFRKHKAINAALLMKIREGAEKSNHLALGLRDILEEQDLVGPL